jgi:hypothetical protein
VKANALKGTQNFTHQNKNPICRNAQVVTEVHYRETATVSTRSLTERWYDENYPDAKTTDRTPGLIKKHLVSSGQLLRAEKDKVPKPSWKLLLRRQVQAPMIE